MQFFINKRHHLRESRHLHYRFFFFFQAEDGIRDVAVTGVQTCALPIWGGAGTTGFCAATSSARSTRIVRCKLRRLDRIRYLLHGPARRDGSSKEVPPMPESHRFIVDRHEGDLAVVEVDGGPPRDLPRWFLPHATRPDDVLLVSIEQGTDRTAVTIVRDVVATERARAAARQAVDRLQRRNPGGDVIL